MPLRSSEKLELPATVYLATGFVGSPELHWTIRLERALTTSRHSYLDLSDCGLRKYSLQNLRSRTFVRLVSRFYQLPYDLQQEIVQRAVSRLGDHQIEDYSPFEMMTWNDVRDFAANYLVEFGAHTVHHRTVKPLDDEQLENEIGGSISKVSSQVQRVSNTFAYPNGTANDFDERAEKILRDHGIIAALSTIDGLNSIHSSPYALRRITIGSHISLDEFRLRVSGMVDTLKSWVSSDHD